MSRRSVLVTGAGGFVGQALTSGFAGLGWDVVGVDRVYDAEPGGASVAPSRGRLVPADLAAGVPRDIAAVDVVVHAAWLTTDPGTLGVTSAAYVELNLRPLRAVLDFAARTRPEAFVFLSSSGVFGPGDGSDGLRDTDPPRGTSPYALAKRAAEAVVAEGVAPATASHVVRLGYLFGPGEVARSSRARISQVAGWVEDARAGRPLPVRADDPRRDWTFTGDLAGALARLLDGPSAKHPVHLASPHVWTDSELADLVVSRLPGAGTVVVPGDGAAKPPMVPSGLPALDGFAWTEPPEGLDALLEAEAAA